MWSKNRLCVFPPEVNFGVYYFDGQLSLSLLLRRCGGATGGCGVGFATAVFCIFFGSIVSVFSPSCGTVFVAVSFPFVIGWVSLETGVTSAESLGVYLRA